MEDHAPEPRPDGVNGPPVVLPPDLHDLGGDEEAGNQEDLYVLLERVVQILNSSKNADAPAVDHEVLTDLLGLLEHRLAYYEDQIQLEMLVERPSSLAKYVLWDGSSGMVDKYRRVVDVLNTLIAELRTLAA